MVTRSAPAAPVGPIITQRRPVSVTPGPRPSTEMLHARRGRRDRSLLRWGVSPLLIAADAGGWATGGLLMTLLTGERLDATAGLLVLASILLLNKAGGFYRSRLTLSLLDDLPGLVGRSLAAGALATTALVVLGTPVDVAVVRAAAVTAVAVAVLRGAAYKLVRVVRSSRRVAHRTVVLGAGTVGGQIAQLLLDHPEYGLQPVGFLDDDPYLPVDKRPVPVLSDSHSLEQVIVEFGIRNVVIAFSGVAESRMVDIVRTCDRLDTEIFFVPRLFELHHTSRDMDEVWGLPLVRLRRAAFRTAGWKAKRVLDVVVSGLALVALAPVLAVLALLVRLDGGPGVLFRQQRIGLDGRPFDVLKFRSLRPATEGESQTTWNIAGDDRLTRLTRFLRASSLDELPQLWNILRGDMTLVGPRPERPQFVDTFSQLYPRYTARHRVPAGLTGWAQVHGLRGDTSIAERARFDNYYIENWSLWSDIKIILRTTGAVLRRAGA